MEKTIIITGGSDGLDKTLSTDLAKDNRVIILATNEIKMRYEIHESWLLFVIFN